MHELSIAASIVDAVTESVVRYPGARVKEVRLRLGALASVIEDSLQFCWGVSVEGTPLEGVKTRREYTAGRGALHGVRQAGRTREFAEFSLSALRSPRKRRAPGTRTRD